MSWYYRDRHAEKEEAQRRINQRRKKGESLEPILPAAGGRTKISTTFWGQAWCRHLESFSDYENRLPRGRSYLRSGSVLDLTIAEGSVSATVAGSHLYETQVTITALPKKDWKQLVAHCSGHVGSMLDLLGGKLGDDTLRLLTDRENGIFPKPRQMRFSCSCPDWADMCKHVAAVLYGVAVRLDQDPSLLFVLRGVDSADLLGEAAASSMQDLADAAGAGAELGDADLSALFGIDLGDEDSSVSTPVAATPPKALKPRKKAAGKKKPKAKVAKKKSPAKKAAKKGKARSS